MRKISIDLNEPEHYWKAQLQAIELAQPIGLSLQCNVDTLQVFLHLLDSHEFSDLRDNLFTLDLSRNQMGAGGAKALAVSKSLGRLTTLDLSWNKIGADGAQALAVSESLGRLATLDLSWNKIGAGGAQALAASESLGHLTTLDLSWNKIGADGAQALAESQSLGDLTTLYLSANEMGDDGIKALAESKSLSRLTTLNLSYNQIGDQGATALAGSKSLDGLTILNLQANELGNEGAAALAASQSLGDLTTLGLGSNQIGDSGASALATPQSMGFLSTLDLRTNQIGDSGANALACSQKLRGLTTLDLSQNQIGDSGATALAASESLGRLTTLSLLGNKTLSAPDKARRSISELRRHYQLRDRLRLKPLTQIRVLLLGVPHVGKTTLFEALTGQDYELGMHERTHGFNHQVNTTIGKGVQTRAKGVLDFTLDFWDFAGDTLQHMIHTFFVREQSLYLLVLNQESPDSPDGVYHWLDQLASQYPKHQGRCEVIPVINPDAEIGMTKGLYESIKDLLEEYRSETTRSTDPPTTQLDLHRPVPVNLAPQKMDVEQLNRAIRQSLEAWDVTNYFEVHEQLADIVQSWNMNCMSESDFVNRLIDERAAQTAYEAYLKQASELGSCGQDDFYKEALHYLDHIGVVFFLESLDCIVLNPDWVSKGLYALLPPLEDENRGDHICGKFRKNMVSAHADFGFSGVFTKDDAHSLLHAIAKKENPLASLADAGKLFEIICDPRLNLVINLADVGHRDLYFMPAYLEESEVEFKGADLLVKALNTSAVCYVLESIFWPPYFIYQHMVWSAQSHVYDRHDNGIDYHLMLVDQDRLPGKNHYWLQEMRHSALRVEVVFWGQQIWLFGHIENPEDHDAMEGLLNLIMADLDRLLGRLVEPSRKRTSVKGYVPCPVCIEDVLGKDPQVTRDVLDENLGKMGVFPLDTLIEHRNTPTSLSCSKSKSHTRTADSVRGYLFKRNVETASDEEDYLNEDIFQAVVHVTLFLYHCKFAQICSEYKPSLASTPNNLRAIDKKTLQDWWVVGIHSGETKNPKKVQEYADYLTKEKDIKKAIKELAKLAQDCRGGDLMRAAHAIRGQTNLCVKNLKKLRKSTGWRTKLSKVLKNEIAEPDHEFFYLLSRYENGELIDPKNF